MGLWMIMAYYIKNLNNKLIRIKINTVTHLLTISEAEELLNGLKSALEEAQVKENEDIERDSTE